MLSLEKRRLQDDLIVAFQYPNGANMKDGEGLFKRVCSDRLRENGFSLRVGLDWVSGRYSVKVVRYWKEEVAQRSCTCPSPSLFKARLDGALSNLVQWNIPCEVREVETK